MAGPMFISSTPELVIAQCTSGILGAMPALNPRSAAALDEAIAFIVDTLAGHDRANPDKQAAPYAINLVAHRTNDRLLADLDVIVRHKVPLVIVSLAAPVEIVDAIHDYGGLVFNDIISDRHARKCADAGVDGLIAVGAGAGGHTGNLSPFALVQEIREWWQGPLTLSGCIATGRAVLAAEVMGADFAYIGSPFLASAEANTHEDFKAMVVACSSKDVVVTNCFTGVDATFLRPSLEAHGLDPAVLVRPEGLGISIKDGGADAKAWRDIWSAGQGIAAVKSSGPAAEWIEALARDYAAERRRWGIPVE
ncbi:MAG: 2-nitropropane dioxygenase [Alphaproteobacteria bacterium]|nr:2-nitropropane dioxygenase [Alphaproteobacteria bacterium]